MQDFYDIPPETLAMTLRAFQPIIKARGYQAQLYRGKYNFLILKRKDGKEFNMYSCTSPEKTYFSGLLADDKMVSYYFLDQVGAKQPETLYFRAADFIGSSPQANDSPSATASSDDQKIAGLLDRHQSLVVKPVDGAHGNNVFLDLQTLAEVKSKITKIANENPDAKILIQEQLAPHSYETRIICIDYQFVAAFARIPAQVTGDGEHTAVELIDIENDTLRTEPYKSRLAYIDRPSAIDYLELHHQLDYVPAKGEKLQVLGICNIGRGGTVEDVSATISVETKALAEKIAKKFQLQVIGIDFLDDYVLEVNGSPSLYYPTPDKSSTLCVEKFADLLDRL